MRTGLPMAGGGATIDTMWLLSASAGEAGPSAAAAGLGGEASMGFVAVQVLVVFATVPMVACGAA